MDFQKIVEILDSYIRNRFSIGDDPDYGLDTDLFEYGFLDSLGAIDVIMYLEESLKIEITQKDITLYPMNTVNEIAEVVAGKF